MSRMLLVKDAQLILFGDSTARVRCTEKFLHNYMRRYRGGDKEIKEINIGEEDKEDKERRKR